MAEIKWNLRLSPGSGEYSSISTWETHTSTNLTAGDILLFSHGGLTGTISDGATVTGQTSLAQGTAVGLATETQILIEGITGTFQSGEQVQVDASNHVTLSDAGTSTIVCVLECYDDWTTGYVNNAFLDITGATTSSTNHRIIRAASGNRHNGYDILTGFFVTSTTPGGIDVFWRVNEQFSGVEFIGFEYEYTGANNAAAVGAQAANGYFLGCLVDGTASSGANSACFGNFNGTGEYLSCYAIGGVRGFQQKGSGGQHNAYNCIAKDCTTGFDTSANANYDIRNCYGFECTTNYSMGTGSATSSTTNGASDAATNTPPGTSPITTNIAATDVNNEALNDMTPKTSATATIYQTGTDLGTLYPPAGELGIDGSTFATTWNIGAFANSISAGIAIPLVTHHIKQMAGH